MARPRPLSAALACGLALALPAIVGCGPKGELGDEARKELAKGNSVFGGLREGLIFPLDGVDYNVIISRQLNVRDPEDRQYYRGPEPRRGFTLFAVFLRACNRGEGRVTRQAAREIAVVDTQDNTFQPLPLSESNVFAYSPQRLAPGECIPSLSSATNFAPTGGAMLLYELPITALENRPLELELEGTFDAFKHERQSATVELDV